MKVVKITASVLLSLSLTFPGLAGNVEVNAADLGSAVADRQPVVFEAAPNPSGPDEVVQLIGEGFDEDSMMIYRVPDENPGKLKKLVGQSRQAEQLNAEQALNVPVVKRSANAISGVIPGQLKYGVYALWARNGTTLSNPILINNTEVYYVYPDKLNTARNREVRVIGKNLSLHNGNKKAYVYLKDSKGKIHNVHLSDVSQYNLKFDVPKKLPAGDYEVWVNNGHGGAYSWGDVQTLTIVNDPLNPTFNILDYGATPNDDTVDSDAIENTVIAAVYAGGGEIIVPEGRFLIDRTIDLQQDVMIKGIKKKGTYKSTIEFVTGDPLGASADGIGPEMINLGSRSGVKDLKIIGSVSVDRGIVLQPGAEDVLIQGNHIDNYFPTKGIKGYFSGVFGDSPQGYKRIVIDDNTFEGKNAINLNNLTLSKISGNTILCRSNTPMTFIAASKNIIEGNHIDGRNVEGIGKANRGIAFNTGGFEQFGLGYGSTEMNFVAENLIEYVGDQVQPTNDGEYILFDCICDLAHPSSMYYGPVASADATSIQVSGVNWQPDQMRNMHVVVVEGKGLGQYGKVIGNSADTLYLDKGWIVHPDATSKITMTRFSVKNIVYHNTEQNSKRHSFMLWGTSIGNILDGNRSAEGGSRIVSIDFGRGKDFAPSYYNEIKNFTGNHVYVTYRDYGQGPNPRSINSLANTAKNNEAEIVRIGNTRPQNDQASILYTLLERNLSSAAAIEVPNNAEDSILWYNKVRAQGVPQRYADKGIDTLIVDHPAISAPSRVYTEPNSGYVKIRWDSVNDADGYFVMRSDQPNGDYTDLTNGQPTSELSYEDHAVQEKKVYYYRIAAWNEKDGQGDTSEPLAGYNGDLLYTSSLDFSGVQGQRYWSYDDGEGGMAFADGQWINADQSVAIGDRSATISRGEGIREWVVPEDGIVRLYGYVNEMLGDQTEMRLKITLNEQVLQEGTFLDRAAVDLQQEYEVRQGDVIRFVLSGNSDTKKQFVTEFAIDHIRKQVIFKEDFNLYETGEAPENYRYGNGFRGQVSVEEMPGSGDKSLAIYSQGGTQTTDTPHVFFDLPEELTSGKYEVSWDTMHTGDGLLNYSMYLGNSDLSDSGPIIAYGVYWVISGGWKKASDFSSPVDQWQHIKAVVDLDTRQYEVYIDGEKLVLDNGASLLPYKDDSFKAISMDLLYGRWTGTAYLDNVKVVKLSDS